MSKGQKIYHKQVGYPKKKAIIRIAPFKDGLIIIGNKT